MTLSELAPGETAVIESIDTSDPALAGVLGANGRPALEHALAALGANPILRLLVTPSSRAPAQPSSRQPPLRSSATREHYPRMPRNPAAPRTAGLPNWARNRLKSETFRAQIAVRDDPRPDSGAARPVTRSPIRVTPTSFMRASTSAS